MIPTYDVIVIGGGAAGLTAAEIANLAGVRVAMIEKHLTGGECTWTGCVPSKTLLAVAKKVHQARHAAQYGIEVPEVRVNFAQVMQHVRATIHTIYHEETPAALRAIGIDVYESAAHFIDTHQVALADGQTLRAKAFILATGAKPHIPAGFDAVPYLTHETLFDLTELPEHLIIIGGGPVGVEMAQAFCRLGSQVTLIERAAQLLLEDDAEASALITEILRTEGIAILHHAEAISAKKVGSTIEIVLADGRIIIGSHVLLATGKTPDVTGLQPDAAGLATHNGQLVVNARLRTNQPHIFAAGDVAGTHYFTHAAGSQAAAAVLNLLLPFPVLKNPRIVPHATFTDPEVAQAGLTEAQAHARFSAVQVTRLPFTRSDRAMTEGKKPGFMKLIHLPNGKLLGATMVGWNAGEMMNEWAQVIERGGNVRDVALATHIYPTLGTTNAILATEQLRQWAQADGFWMRLLRGLVRMKVRLL